MKLQCNHLSKYYASPRGNVDALQDLSFQAEEGEFLCIVGPSGCGKSTLLRLLAGILSPDAGEIRYLDWEQPIPPRRAMVFQEQGLFPWMTVLENVAFGLEMQRVPLAVRQQRSRVYLERMGIADFQGHFPHELSGGMRQRAGIARAFVSAAEILLMDEPFRALDAQTRLILWEDLLQLWQDDHKMVIFITHDIEEAVLLADRVLIMSGRPGQIIEEIRIPLDRPRPLHGANPNLDNRSQHDVEELKWHIWNRLEKAARQSLVQGR